jgi:hypothetical protein
MEIETLFVGAGAALATFLLTLLFQRHFNRQHQQEVRQRDEHIHTLEKQAHQKEREFLEQRNRAEREFLEERNRTELAHQEGIKDLKRLSFEEGRQRGLTEGDTRHLAEVASLQSDFVSKIQLEREKAASEARDRLRAEYELQSKLFSVQISPLVRVTENKGLFSAEYQSEVGYQYQLLINGIPAFQPHVIVERSEVRKEVNEENVKELIKSARQIAEGAIDLYLGANGQFAKLALPIIKRLKT